MTEPSCKPPMIVWVVTAQEGVWREAAEALKPIGASIVAMHWDEMAEDLGARPDLLLLDIRGGLDPEKEPRPLRGPSRERVPRLLLCEDEALVDTVLAGDDHHEAIAAVDGAVPWHRVIARSKRMMALSAELSTLRSEHDLAVCARELSGTAIWTLDPDRGLVECSSEIAAELGEEQRQWERNDWPTLLSSISSSATRQLTQAVEAIARRGGTGTVEHSVRGASGEERILLHRIRRLEYGSRKVVGAMFDVTEERESFRKLQKLAHFDGLTGLVTRHHFLSKLGEAVGSSSSENPVSLLYIDLDGLKAVNDRMGHRGGDLLLRYAAGRLRNAIRDTPEIPSRVCESERPVLGRLGGDEFSVILPTIDRASAERLAAQVVDAFREPFEVMGVRLTATASVGIAGAPLDSIIPDELVRYADAAMYEAKGQGGDRWHAYRPSLAESRDRRRDVRDRLRAALEAGELEVHYQPRIRLRNGHVASAEALMRWNSPELGRVSPAEFIPLAEEAGLIGALGQFALDHACQDLRRFDDAGIEPIRISVNVSGAQLMEPGYGEKLFCTLQESGVDPSRVELEVTESVALLGLDRVAQLLREVRTTGVHVALDDFGTGYSSLGVLLDLPLDCLKLDQSVIRDLHTNPDAASVVRAMIVMAHSLGLSVVAEGVTEPSQVQILRELDCDEVQGFLFSEALGAAKLIDFVRQPRTL
ncbi:MAG: EAL domain-containing protein [bacterium]|nr:EAL domain-containing protein [bacterium]